MGAFFPEPHILIRRSQPPNTSRARHGKLFFHAFPHTNFQHSRQLSCTFNVLKLTTLTYSAEII